MVFFVRITVNQSHLRPICKSTKFNPKIQRTIYLINFQQLRLHVPEFIRTVVKPVMEVTEVEVGVILAGSGTTPSNTTSDELIKDDAEILARPSNGSLWD